MASYIPPISISPNSRSITANNTPYTSYTRQHRKRISTLRLSSETTSTLPEYIPTNPSATSIPWRTVPEATEIDDAPPGYSSDSAQEADEDTDLSDQERRQIQKSVFVTAGINSAPATATTFTSSPSLRSRRHKRDPSHRRKRSDPTLNLDPLRSNSDIYLDSLLERSVHALEMSNALLQSSISTKTSLSGILNQETDEDESMVVASRPGSGFGINSLERSARGLSTRIVGNGNVHEAWVEDLKQIGKDVDQLFSEGAQEERRKRNRTRRNDSQSRSSQGSISTSLPSIPTAPLQSFKSHRDKSDTSSGPSSQLRSKHASRKTSLDLQSQKPQYTESSKQYDDMTGVPHLRYGIQDRERFISHPPRALTQYVVAEGDLRHGHEEGNALPLYIYNKDAARVRRRDLGRQYGTNGRQELNDAGAGWTVKKGRLNSQELELPKEDEDEPIILPSTLGLRSTGTHSTIRKNRQLLSRSRSPSPAQTVSRSIRHHRESEQIVKNSTLAAPSTLRIVLDHSPSQSTDPSPLTRAPKAYNMLSSFVYPASSSTAFVKRSNSSSSTTRPQVTTSPSGSPWTSRRSSVNSMAAERPVRAALGTSDNHLAMRRHSTSPAASTHSTRTFRSKDSGSSSTVTAGSGSGSRSRSQTPKPLGSGCSPSSSGRWNMTPPLELSSGSGSGGEGDCVRREGSEDSSDSCPTKQTILSLRKILDNHNPPAKPSDDWTLIHKPPILLQQSTKVGLPVEAGTSTATASISKLFTRGVHSHEGSVTRRYDEHRHSSFKGKGKASVTNSAASSVPPTPTTMSSPQDLSPSKMNFESVPKLLSTSVALALRASSPLSSTPSSGASTPATPGHSKRISFAELPEGTQGTGSERKSRKRKGKQKAYGSRLIDGSGRASYRRQSGSDGETDEPKGWLGWLINAAGVDSGRPDKIDERLGKGWGGLGSTTRGPGYGGMDEWGI